jgi:hypothetical protein
MTRPSTTATVGLVICALLGVVDVISLGGLGADDGPPAGVVVAGAVLGVLTLWGVSIAWRRQRKGAMIVIVTRVISALLGIPAFFVDDVPSWVPPVIGVSLALTAAGAGLVVASLRRGEFAT